MTEFNIRLAEQWVTDYSSWVIPQALWKFLSSMEGVSILIWHPDDLFVKSSICLRCKLMRITRLDLFAARERSMILQCSYRGKCSVTFDVLSAHRLIYCCNYLELYLFFFFLSPFMDSNNEKQFLFSRKLGELSI